MFLVFVVTGNVYIADTDNFRIRKVTAVFTSSPSFTPTSTPTTTPTIIPTVTPSKSPSAVPSRQPTRQPTNQPSLQPSAQPSQSPTAYPTYYPSLSPSIDVITTIAGCGLSYATSTALNYPGGVAVDSSGKSRFSSQLVLA